LQAVPVLRRSTELGPKLRNRDIAPREFNPAACEPSHRRNGAGSDKLRSGVSSIVALIYTHIG
jgi:hypothetical protein